MFRIEKDDYMDLFKGAATEAVQLRLLDIIADDHKRLVLEATVYELAKKINDKRPGTIDTENVTVTQVLANIDILADEHQVGDEGDQKAYKVKTLPPAIANKVWQIQTGGRGTVKAISKINKETDTITCYAELRDGERVISKQMDVPIPYTGYGDQAFEAQRAANLKLGKCLAEVYRYAGIGYYPNPKEDEVQETSPFVTGVFKTETAAVTKTTEPAPAAETNILQPEVHEVVAVVASTEPKEEPDSKIAKEEAAPKVTRRRGRKSPTPAPVSDEMKVETEKSMDSEEATEERKEEGEEKEMPETTEEKVPDGKIHIPAGYPSLKEARAIRSASLNERPLLGDPKFKPAHYIQIYKKARMDAAEKDGTEKGEELAALRVLIAESDEATTLAEKYLPELF